MLQHSDGSLFWRPGQPETPLVKQVLRELDQVAMLSLDRLRGAGGALVVTTIDSKAQAGGVEAIREAAAGQPESLRYSVTAVDPNNGGIRAYVSSDGADFAGGVVKEAGTVLEPFGTAEVMRAAGVPETAVVEGVKTELLADASALLRPLDVAAAYATLGAEGVHHDAHFITHVTDAGGTTLYRAAKAGRPAFDQDSGRSKDFAARVTAGLRGDSSCGPEPDGGCLAGDWKDATAVRHAWMVDYSPRLSIAVFVGADQGPALDAEGKPVAGTGLPNEILREFEQKARGW